MSLMENPRVVADTTRVLPARSRFVKITATCLNTWIYHRKNIRTHFLPTNRLSWTTRTFTLHLPVSNFLISVAVGCNFFITGSAYRWIIFLSPRVVSFEGMEDEMTMRGERTTHTYRLTQSHSYPTHDSNARSFGPRSPWHYCLSDLGYPGRHYNNNNNNYYYYYY